MINLGRDPQGTVGRPLRCHFFYISMGWLLEVVHERLSAKLLAPAVEGTLESL
jgi:hypothetical protein